MSPSPATASWCTCFRFPSTATTSSSAGPATPSLPKTSPGAAPVGFIGVSPSPVIHSSLGGSLSRAGGAWVHVNALTLDAFGRLFTLHGASSYLHMLSNQKAADNPGNGVRFESPVGVVRLLHQAGQSGAATVLWLIAVLNLSLGIFNLLPFFPLDGGHVVVALYEGVRSRRRRRYHADVAKLLPLFYLGLGLVAVPRRQRALPRPARSGHLSAAAPVGSRMMAEPRFPRRATRQVMVGSVPVGGGAPVSLQSMTITKTADVEGTLAQIYALKAAGADIVRCTCNEREAAEGLARIVPRSPVPIVADIHFHVEMALAALEAGVDCLRLNPGNLRKPEEIKLVARECKDRRIPVRIGVNAGSLDPRLYKKYGGATPEALVESAQIELGLFAEEGFDDVKISVKASSVPLMIEAYRQLSEVTDHPLHLGVTEAGPPPAGTIKGTAGIGTLLSEGIGDTIRYSLTADPVEEAKAGRILLESLGLRERSNVDLVACPSCGRAEIDVYKVAQEAQAALEGKEIPLQVAVMGCVVNGPGEARSADLGIAAGRHRGHLFIRGQIVRVVPEDEMVAALVAEAEKLVKEGVAARLAAADSGAAAAAEADRLALLDSKGADANRSEARVELIDRRLRDGNF